MSENCEHAKMYQKQIVKLQNEREELLVLIDTLQTNMRSAVSSIPEDKRESVTGVQSFKWSMGWRKDNQA